MIEDSGNASPSAGVSGWDDLARRIAAIESRLDDVDATLKGINASVSSYAAQDKLLRDLKREQDSIREQTGS
jgi:prefoldin subunit 5